MNNSHVAVLNKGGILAGDGEVVIDHAAQFALTRTGQAEPGGPTDVSGLVVTVQVI